MIWLVASGLLDIAMAGSIYINGVRADLPPVVSLKSVNVRIDANGDVYIDAPGYNVQVVGGAPVAPATSTSNAAVPSAAAVWYLVSEDEGSSSGIVDVYVNDSYVRRVQSGASQVLVDLSSVVHPGLNKVQFVVRTPPVGRLGAYVGVGADVAGALRIDAPSVTWWSGGTETVQEYSFTVR